MASFHWLCKARLWYAVLLCYLSALLFLSLNPWVRPAAGDDLLSPDKLEHALAYGGLAIMVFVCLVRWRNGPIGGTAQAWIAALLFSVLVGGMVEIAQTVFTPNRTGSVADALANAVGASLGFVAYQSVQSIYARWLGRRNRGLP